jgi:hypothetical protein
MRLNRGICRLLCICLNKDAIAWKAPECTKKESEETVLLGISLAITQCGGVKTGHDTNFLSADSFDQYLAAYRGRGP